MPQIKNTKKRNWAFVIYPESYPEDWLEILQMTGAPIAISPLHDKDFNADGEVKKPHYHIIICYDGPTTYNTVKRITDSLNAPIPIPLEQVRGYYRYLTHKDNPEKAQYNEREIKCLNGFDIGDFIELTKSETEKIKKGILDVIDECNLFEYADLINILRTDQYPSEYFGIATTSTMLFNTYLKSKRYRRQYGKPITTTTDKEEKRETDKNQ